MKDNVTTCVKLSNRFKPMTDSFLFYPFRLHITIVIIYITIVNIFLKKIGLKGKKMQQSFDLNMIGTRVKAIRASLNLRQNQFAQKLEVSQSFLSYIEKGQRKPSFEFLLSLLSNFEINLNWFFTGQGEMFRRDGETKTLIEGLGRLFPGLHPDQDVILLVESLEVPIMKNALMEKFLLYRKKYEEFIREYRLKKEKNQEAEIQ